VGRVPGFEVEAFLAAAEDAKKNCPVSQALTGTTITLSAKLA
jgi:osmotically inducible protein OsmC